jgi:hypothetical protein
MRSITSKLSGLLLIAAPAVLLIVETAPRISFK